MGLLCRLFNCTQDAGWIALRVGANTLESRRIACLNDARRHVRLGQDCELADFELRHHSGAVLAAMSDSDVQTYIPEPERGRRDWSGRKAIREMVYANRRRVRSKRGHRLLKLRSELVERSFAHMYETGGMRRTHLRGRDNILKRLLIHAVAFNIALLVRKLHGIGKPRTLQGASPELLNALLSLWIALTRLYAAEFIERAAWDAADEVAA